MSTEYPGMWRFPKCPVTCCIYRVPENVRRVNPEAYTPQLLIIGPLHHSLKYQALRSRGDITNTKSMGYINMEEHKKIYLANFAERLGNETINGFRRIIKEDEILIRESYSELTTWIESSDFVEMILHDSVFIVEFILRTIKKEQPKTGDPLMDEPCLGITIKSDLMLLENQLPYFILEKITDPIFHRLSSTMTLRELIITYFRFKDKIKIDSNFKHFTDLARLVRVETLPGRATTELREQKQIYNADRLHSGGVKFEAVEKEFSLELSFVKGCLKMPCLYVDDSTEVTLRNVMALEQCHYPYEAYVCSYVLFLDYLIDSDKDVDLLVEKGIIENWLGQPSAVAEMVNKLGLGIGEVGNCYFDITAEINAHYKNKVTRSKSILKNVYFGNMWIGTATLAAIFLLLLTLVQAVTSLIQVLSKKP